MNIKILLLAALLILTLQSQQDSCNVRNCLSCNSQNVCVQCQQNFVLQSIGTGSFRCIQNGLDSQNIRILQTNSGNNTDSGSGNNTATCTTITNCQTCTNQSSCTKCKTGFQLLDSGKCLSCNVVNCQSCSQPDICDKCSGNNTSIRPSTTGGACVSCNLNSTNLAGCLSCNKDNSCGLCQNQYQLVVQDSGLGICVKCEIQNCRKCKRQGNQTTCNRCAPGYSPIGSKCIKCRFPCVTCTQAQGPNNCATCAFPLYFENAAANGTCVINPIPGCRVASTSDPNLCSQCLPGYTLNSANDTCTWGCPDNCASCTSATSCITCNSGFYKNANGLCSQCKTRGCATCGTDGSGCTVALLGFYLQNSEPKVCPGYCKNCSSSTSCNQLAITINQVIIIINGKTMLAVCQSNCVTCSNLNPSICLECSEGFYLSNGKCKKCGGDCQTCDSSNQTKCLSCFPNTFLSAGTCKGCDPTCLTCQSASAPTVCTSCKPGSYLSSGKCTEGCPKNCFDCSDANTCIECVSGYTLFTQDSTTICAPCITSCRTCAKGQPAACLSCGAGFFMSAGQCVQCGQNCDVCISNTTCTTCSEGYYLTGEQTCAPNCAIPCATCTTSDPTKCTSCVAGYTYDNVNGVCNGDLTCGGSTCVVCPRGYSLKAGVCIKCTSSNCFTCSPDAPSACLGCRPTYFLNDAGTCQTCPSSCRTCISSLGCLTCAAGFTKKANAPLTPRGYQCVACDSPCRTCVNSPRRCTSCIDGFRKNGWKCARRFRFGFKIKFGGRLRIFNGLFFRVIRAFAGVLRSRNTDAVCFGRMKEGSIDTTGQIAPTGDPGSTDAADQLNSVYKLINSGNVGGATVESASVEVAQGSVGSSSSTDNTPGIVLGIVIPVGVLIILGVIFLIIKAKKSRQLNEKDQVNYDQGSHKNINYQDKYAV